MNQNIQNESKEEIDINNNKLKSNKGPYVLGEKLGEGAFAKVRLATQIQIKEKCAVKILEKKLLESSRDIQRLKKEIKILKKLRHKNIIQLYDIMESKRNLYFVMEYCKGGELFDYIVSKKRLKEPEACTFFQQIINGVDYLHKQGIIHRDLKPENLLLDDKNHIKISDFGLSTFFSKNNYLQTACGTPSYAPPEMLEGHEYNGEATDVWSCGIILYAMLCGTLPFSESQEEIIVKKIKTHDYTIPNYLSKDAKDLLNHILKIDPKERYNIKQIINHPWFNLVKPHMVPGINLDEDIIPVDDKILDMVKNYGFDPIECKDLLLKNKFCSLTTIYNLCLKKYVRENGKSISDLESDLFEEYILNPDNKIKKIELKKEKVTNGNNINNKNDKDNKDNNSGTRNIRLPLKKINTIKNDRNTSLIDDKRNGTPTINYIKIGADKRNLNSTKNIKKGSISNEKDKKNKINYNNKSSFKEGYNEQKINSNGNKVENRIINKNKSPTKTTAKTIRLNKATLIKNQRNDKDRAKNTSIRKKKLKIINTNKNNQNLTTEQKPKTVRHETEHKPITSKFILSEKNISKEKPGINPINANVNIINININNNPLPIHPNYNLTEVNQNFSSNINTQNTFSDKEIYLLKKKLNEINQGKAQNEMNNKNENINILNNNMNIDMREEEDEIKNILNTFNLKDLNISSNNQNNTFSTLSNNYYNNNINNSNLYSSIFQDSTTNNKTKTFIDNTQNYSLQTENNININNSRPKSSLFQYLGNDIEKYMLLKGERPINVINYIAKKLVAASFCGSFNIQNNNSNTTNNNINQMASFFKKPSEDRSSLRKSNGNAENKNENSFENNSIIKDTSLFVNDDNNDDKDSNFKNLVSILNKKFKSYLSNEKLNKTEIGNKDNEINSKKIGDNKILNINKNSYINEIKNEGNKNELFKSFNFRKNNNENDVNYKNDNNSYIIFSYSKNDKENKINQKTQAKIKYNKNVKDDNREIKNELKDTSYRNQPKIKNYNSHFNTFLDISATYEPNMDSRNSSIDRSISFKKKEIRNFSLSPAHEKKKENNINMIKKVQICSNNKDIPKKNHNFNTISEDDELKNLEKKNIDSKSKKRKKFPICHDKVTINLFINEDNNNKTNNNKKGNSKLKKIVTKKVKE